MNDNYNHEQIVDYILSLDIKNYNMIGKGYKYYAPKGVVRVKANEYNDVLRKDNNIYYLYVDVVSYFYKTKNEYKGYLLSGSFAIDVKLIFEISLPFLI